MVWYLPPGADNTRLQAYIDQFFLRLEEDGTLEELREQYFGHNAGFSRMSSHTFNSNMRNTLPTYKALIQQVAEEYQLDWRLLAAVAYQESHWNPTATSPTGVRGMMMLTHAHSPGNWRYQSTGSAAKPARRVALPERSETPPAQGHKRSGSHSGSRLRPTISGWVTWKTPG